MHGEFVLARTSKASEALSECDVGGMAERVFVCKNFLQVQIFNLKSFPPRSMDF